jgi:hypothetical protein
MKYELNQRVRHADSGQHGIVVGRVEFAPGYRATKHSYLVRHVDDGGQARGNWWGEAELQPVGPGHGASDEAKERAA